MGLTVSGSVWPCYAAHKGSWCNSAEKQTTVCAATIIRTWLPSRVLYIYAFPKTCLPWSQLRLILFFTPLQVVSAVTTCQMSKDCVAPVWAKAKSLGIDKSLGGRGDEQWVGVGAQSLKAGQGEAMTITNNIKRALLLLTSPKLVAVYYR